MQRGPVEKGIPGFFSNILCIDFVHLVGANTYFSGKLAMMQ